MRLKLLLVAGTLSLSACGTHAPKVTWCVIDGKNIAVYCQDPQGKQTELTILQADKFIAQPKRDAEILRNYVLDLEKQLAHCH